MTNPPVPPQVQPPQQAQQPTYSTPNKNLNMSTEHIYASGGGGGLNTTQDLMNTSMPLFQAKPQQPPAPPPPNKPAAGWRNDVQTAEALPSDSLYQNGGRRDTNASWREKQKLQSAGSRPGLNNLAAWSSHGYLAKANDNSVPNQVASPGDSGYVLLKRGGDGQMVTVKQQPNQPQSLPSGKPGVPEPLDKKYFSVKNFGDMRNKHDNDKYLSMDPRYHSIKNLPPDIRSKLRENLQNPYKSVPVPTMPAPSYTNPPPAPTPPPGCRIPTSWGTRSPTRPPQPPHTPLPTWKSPNPHPDRFLGWNGLNNCKLTSPGSIRSSGRGPT